MTMCKSRGTITVNNLTMVVFLGAPVTHNSGAEQPAASLQTEMGVIFVFSVVNRWSVKILLIISHTSPLLMIFSWCLLSWVYWLKYSSINKAGFKQSRQSYVGDPEAFEETVFCFMPWILFLFPAYTVMWEDLLVFKQCILKFCRFEIASPSLPQRVGYQFSFTTCGLKERGSGQPS